MSRDNPASLTIQIFDKSHHDRSAFSSGDEPLDVYLKTRASHDQRNNLSFPYVLTDPQGKILGYYTLSATSVSTDALPASLARKIGYDLAPAVLLGRLAVDHAQQGQGYGKYLLVDALRRIARSGDIAVLAVLVDPKNAQARAFCEHFGFSELEAEGGRMFVPFKTIKDI